MLIRRLVVPNCFRDINTEQDTLIVEMEDEDELDKKVEQSQAT